MPDLETIEEFLAQDHLAFVGVSRHPKQFANMVYRHLRARGRTLYPVNPSADGQLLEGDKSYQRLADVPDPVGGVIVMVPAGVAAEVTKAALERGIPRVWLHRGIGTGAVSAEAVELCRRNGVQVVDGACPMMFEQPVSGVHRIHRAVARRRFAA